MGTRNTPFLPKHLGQDHPHAYGDKGLIVGLGLHMRGSSPRVWGQEVAVAEPSAEDRIIPTRMGTSHQRL